ncbi:MAG: glutamate--tRNA ligase, partial [Sulfurovum sp.]|nr:glutamate--tRNA ligase [Sulfurovum sp.]
WMFKEGFVPDAIINYLLLLGNTEVPKEIFTLPEAIESFKLENISKTAVEFDIEKLRFINREHLKRIEDIPFSALFGFADADIGKLAKLYLEECSTTKGIQTKIDAIFSPKVLCEPYGEQMSILAELIQDAPMFSTFDAFNTHLMKTSGLKGENYMNPLRYLLTGTDTGPELSELFPLINPYLLEIATCTPSSTL